MAEEEVLDGDRRRLLMGVCALSVVVMVSAGLFGDRGVRKHALLEAQLNELSERRVELERKNGRLAAEAQALRESPEYVEWVIREELGWLRPGERVLRLKR